MSNADNSFNRERLIALFIKSNNLLSEIKVSNFDDHFTFEDPVDLGSESKPKYELDQNNDLGRDFRNTMVMVKAKTQSPYFGRKKLLYNRLSGGDLPEIIVNVTNETSVHQLLTKINTKYGLFLTEKDVNDDAVTGTGEISIPITFNPTSLIFNDHITINLTIEGGNASTNFGASDTVGGSSSAPITE